MAKILTFSSFIHQTGKKLKVPQREYSLKHGGVAAGV